MRIRIEIEWAGQPWRRLKTVKAIALIDMFIGILLALMYIYKLCFPHHEPTFIQYARTHREQGRYLKIHDNDNNLIFTIDIKLI